MQQHTRDNAAELPHRMLLEGWRSTMHLWTCTMPPWFIKAHPALVYTGVTPPQTTLLSSADRCSDQKNSALRRPDSDGSRKPLEPPPRRPPSQLHLVTDVTTCTLKRPPPLRPATMRRGTPNAAADDIVGPQGFWLFLWSDQHSGTYLQGSCEDNQSCKRAWICGGRIRLVGHSRNNIP